MSECFKEKPLKSLGFKPFILPLIAVNSASLDDPRCKIARILCTGRIRRCRCFWPHLGVLCLSFRRGHPATCSQPLMMEVRGPMGPVDFNDANVTVKRHRLPGPGRIIIVIMIIIIIINPNLNGNDMYLSGVMGKNLACNEEEQSGYPPTP